MDTQAAPTLRRIVIPGAQGHNQVRYLLRDGRGNLRLGTHIHADGSAYLVYVNAQGQPMKFAADGHKERRAARVLGDMTESFLQGFAEREQAGDAFERHIHQVGGQAADVITFAIEDGLAEAFEAQFLTLAALEAGRRADAQKSREDLMATLRRQVEENLFAYRPGTAAHAL
jgi:hypothetical protein